MGFSRRLRFSAQVWAATIAVVVLAFTCGLAVAGPPAEDLYGQAGDAVGGATGTPLDLEMLGRRAKDDTLFWNVLAGARFGEREGRGGTPFELDFFDVSFRGPASGFAVGAECRERVDPKDSDFEAKIRGCERVPVIWRYTELGGWQESFRGTAPGFAGGVAFIDDNRVLAVGGSGKFPRREPNGVGADATWEQRVEKDRTEGAGLARAWLYENGAWRELSDLPAGMRGLNAVDFWVGSGEPGKEDWGAVGGLGQIWLWKGDGFKERFDKDVAAPHARDAHLFQARVRQIQIAPDPDHPHLFASTAGCCGEKAADGTPEAVGGAAARRIEYLDVWEKQDYVCQGATNCVYTKRYGEPKPPEEPRWTVTADPAPAATLPPLSLQHRWYDPQADSVYAFDIQGSQVTSYDFTRFQYVFRGLEWFFGEGRVRAAGGPPADEESAFRFVAGGGDSEPSSFNSNYPAPPPGNGHPDWRVGEWRSVDRGLGGQALFETSLEFRPNVPLVPVEGNLTAGEVKLVPEKRYRDSVASRTYRLPSYALNAVEMLDEVDEGWAVGDHGAIARFGGTKETAGGSEPPPPTLGGRERGAAPETAPYDPHRRPPSAEAGVVPALQAQPRTKLSRPQLVPAGAPDATTRAAADPPEGVSTIVMSRDGDQGWALGSHTIPSGGSGGLGLFRFDGTRWARCEAVGIQGIVEADPMCARLGPLYRQQEESQNSWVRITAAARVPLEHDADPFNNDEFEVLAVGNHYRAPGDPRAAPIALRYSEGEGWRIESWQLRSSLLIADGANSLDRTDGQPPKDLVLTGPDEGWLLTEANALFRFDGERFIDCWSTPPTRDRLVNAEQCSDREGRLANIGRRGVAPATLTKVGERVFLGGTRADAGTEGGGVATISAARRGAPVILHKDEGAGSWGEAQLDPAQGSEPGAVGAFSITERPGGGYEGFAFGGFGGISTAATLGVDTTRQPVMRLGDGGRWRSFAREDAAFDYLQFRNLDGAAGAEDGYYPWLQSGRVGADLQVTLPGTETVPAKTFVTREGFGGLLEFDPVADRFRVFESDAFTMSTSPQAAILAMAPDQRGGFWAAVVADGRAAFKSGRPAADVFFYRYATERPREVFEEVSHPVGSRRITALAGGGDGAVWLTTDSDTLYRYDRATGFDRVRIPGWDVGRIVTSPASVLDVAIGADGRGVAVGERGRIANLGPDGAVLDPAAGAEVCAPGSRGPCSTGRDLRAVSVASDGSAMAGGDGVALLWRPPGGAFHAISRPSVARTANVSDISMPAPGRAWLITNQGHLLRGDEAGGEWKWQREAVDGNGKPITRARARNIRTGEPEPGEPLRLRAIAMRPDGTGYAVGDEGLVLERAGDGSWRRHELGRTDDLFSVTLPVRGDGGVLVGGRNGLILTLTGGHFEVAREADFTRALSGPISDLALLPGLEPGQVEAWGSVSPNPDDSRRAGGDMRTGVGQLLHFANDPGEPLLQPDKKANPLPDVPAPRTGEVTFAAFGRSDCRSNLINDACPELLGGPAANDLVARRVRDEMAARAKRQGGRFFALHTGDAYDTGGPTGRPLTEPVPGLAEGIETANVDGARPGSVKYRRLNELIFEKLEREGVGVLGAIGGRDLSETKSCAAFFVCTLSTRDGGINVGENLAWRQGMASRPGGWGTNDPIEAGGLRFVPVERNQPTYLSDQRETKIGAARTHYASDVEDAEGRKVARVVVVDTSQRSLSGSNAQQQPAEEQQTWLEQVLCVEGTVAAAGRRCTRERGQPAIVLSNTPTYSYGPGAGTDTQTDAAAFEALLMRHRASVVVSGRLGWNGRYWATAPGLHEPCPGGGYQDTPPSGTAPVCGRSAGDVPADPGGASGRLSDALRGAGVEPPNPSEVIDEANPTRLLPFVVASTAGGQFGPDGQGNGEARNGFWRGYSVVRLPADGDPRGVIVEQRPIFDWIRISAQEHVLRPGQRMTLRGEGREPVGAPNDPANGRFDRIDSAAITHRYDLLEADPDKPYLPRKDADGEYVPLDPSVATINAQTGVVRAGRGNHPRTFAIGLLSVADEAATYPLVFEPRKSFAPEPPARIAAAPLRNPAPPIRTLAANPSIPPQASPPATPPVGASPTFPPTPALPAPPPPFAGTTPQPPAPPAPPPPPPPQLPTALDLLASPPSVPLAPQATVIPPPAPPIQPAPPGGARREARQRQAAVQKGEEGGSEGAGGSEQGGVDTAENPAGPPGAAMRRRDQDRPEPSFTAVARGDQPSAWARGALYGGALTLLALAASLTWIGVRPGRRHPTPRPAPGYIRTTDRRR